MPSVLYTNSKKTRPVFQRACLLHKLPGDTTTQHAPNSCHHNWTLTLTRKTARLCSPAFPSLEYLGLHPPREASMGGTQPQPGSCIHSMESSPVFPHERGSTGDARWSRREAHLPRRALGRNPVHRQENKKLQLFNLVLFSKMQFKDHIIPRFSFSVLFSIT